MERRVRRIGLGLLVAAAVLGLLAAAWPHLLGAVLTEALRRNGLAEAVVEVMSTGAVETAVDLRLSGGRARVTVRHPLGRLIAGRVESVTVSGATLRVPLDGAVPAGTGAGRIPALPADRIVIEDSRIILESEGRSAEIAVAGRLDRGEATIDLRGRALDLGLLARAAGFEAAVLGNADVTGTLRGRVDGAIALAPVDCLTITVAGLAVNGEPVDLPKGLCLRATDAPATDAPVIETAGDGLRLRGMVTAAALVLPSRRLAAEDVSLTASYARDALDAELVRGMLRSQDRPAPFAPIALTGKASRAGNGPLTFQAKATGPGGVLLEGQGRHDLVSGAGTADLRLRPLIFHDGTPSLAALLPGYAGAVSAAGGSIAGRGRLAWGGAFISEADLLLKELEATAGPVTVGGVSGVLHFSSLFPPVLPSGQSVAVKLLDVGLPLTDGRVTMGLTRRGVLDVDAAEWRWAGGLIRAKPFEIALASPKGTIDLEAEGLDLGTVLAIAPVEGLDAVGTLRGSLPVRIERDRVRLDGGILESAGPGTLRYDPAKPPDFLKGDPGSPTDLLMSALTDFHFDSLRATIDGEAGGEMRVGLSVSGANPEFYGGHPVALNLKLSGALDRILRQGLDAYRIPDAVRERMLEFEKKGPS